MEKLGLEPTSVSLQFSSSLMGSWAGQEFRKSLLARGSLTGVKLKWKRRVCASVYCYQFSSVQSLSGVRLFATPWIAACQASLSITNSRGLLKLMSIESVMTSSHLILCRPLLLLPPIPPSIRVFSMEIFKSATYSYYSALVLSLFLGKISVSLISFS